MHGLIAPTGDLAKDTNSKVVIPHCCVVPADQVERQLYDVMTNKAVEPDMIPSWLLRDMTVEPGVRSVRV